MKTILSVCEMDCHIALHSLTEAMSVVEAGLRRVLTWTNLSFSSSCDFTTRNSINCAIIMESLSHSINTAVTKRKGYVSRTKMCLHYRVQTAPDIDMDG